MCSVILVLALFRFVALIIDEMKEDLVFEDGRASAWVCRLRRNEQPILRAKIATNFTKPHKSIVTYVL